MTSERQSTFLDDLSAAARDNPLAAALIGGGALWLLMNKSGTRVAESAYAEAVGPAAEDGLRGLKNATSAGRDAAGDLIERGRAAANELGEGIASGARSLKDTVTDRTSDILRSAPDAFRLVDKNYSEAQSALTTLFERQPLVIGAIGVAIGAGIASSAAVSKLENEWAGPASDAVKEAFKARAGEAAQPAIDAANEIKRDVCAAGEESFDKLREIATDAARAVGSTESPAVR
jgi:hypothetical protein